MSNRWICINRKPQFKAFLKLLYKQDWVAADTETTGLIWFRHQICGISFSFDIDEQSEFATNKGEVDVYIPIRHTTGEKQLDANFVLLKLRPFFERKNLTTIWHNAKFDALMLRSEGVNVAGTMYDTWGLHTLLESSTGNYKLGNLAHQLLGAPKWKDAIREWLRIEAKKRKCKIDDLSYADVLIGTMTEYAAQDTRYTWRLFWEYIDDIDDNEDLAYLYHDVETELTKELIDMEYGGALIDVAYLHRLAKEVKLKASLIYDKINRDAEDFISSRVERTTLQRKLKELEAKLVSQQKSGGPTKRIENSIVSTKKKIEIVSKINLDSPKQLRAYLKSLNVPVIKETATRLMSTDKLVLMRLAATGEYPEASDILEYRENSKTLSTFITGMMNWLDGEKRLHTSYNQFGPKSGRLSSSNPNLQNIKRGPMIRRAFITPDGNFIFISIDFSQIELRLAAHFSEDANMLDIYEQDGDIHQRTADMLGCPTRQAAKPVIFGMLYGMGITTLIDNAFRDYEVIYTKSEAKRYFKLFFQRAYPGLREWIEEETDKIKYNQYSETFFGRRRTETDVTKRSVEKWKRESLIRALINHRIQGTAADILKIITVRVGKFLRSKNAKTRMFLNIHDELDFYWHVDEFDLLPQVVELMEDWDDCNFKVPIKVDVSWSPNNWGDKKELRV